ncbi:hypothetical protein MMC17_007889 [Xylographa soralifera]|nr:hypothetical protein [Xylographa soralifera]
MLDEVKFRDRRSSDLSRDDLGCFCAPRPEEWWWNSEIMRRQEEKAERQDVWNGCFDDPGTISQREEASTAEKDEADTETDKLVPAVQLRRRKSSDAHITMRYQNRLDILEWRQDLPNSVTTQSLAVSALAKTDCDPLCRNDCSLKTSSEATVTRKESRASSASSITLSTQEEQVFFDKVRKELPAAQRSIDNEVLRCMDRLREHCDCLACDKWRELKSGIKGQAEREDGWRANWKVMLRRKSSITNAENKGYGADAWAQASKLCRTTH